MRCWLSPKLPRDTYGQAFAQHLIRRWGYQHVHTVGSHLVLRTTIPLPQTIAIPAHKPLRTGTFAAILQSVALHKGVRRDEILDGL